MAKDQAYPSSTALSKKAPENLAVSDYRKETKSFGVLAKGVQDREDIVNVTEALLQDYSAGLITERDAAVYCNILDRDLAAKDQDLRDMEIQLRLEGIGRKAKTPPRRSR